MPLINKSKEFISSVLNSLTHLALYQRSKISEDDLVRVGSNYGGYFVPKSILNSNEQKFLISGGLGYDITFDHQLILNGFRVVGVEPIQSSIQWVSNYLSENDLNSCYTLIQCALSNNNGIESFKPEIFSPNYTWWAQSEVNKNNVSETSFPTVAIISLYNDHRNNSPILIAKFDIEGHEIVILEEIIKHQMKFDWLIIELDYLNLIRVKQIRKRFRRIYIVRRLMASMRRNGYIFASRDGYNYSWMYVPD